MQNTVHKQPLDAYVDMLPISILQAHTDIIHARKKYKEHKRICTHNRDIVYTHSTETLRHTHTQFTHDTTQTHLSTTSVVDRITIRCVIFITIIDWNCEMLQQ